MKRILFVFVFALHCLASQAQELKWHTNVNDAIALSAKEHKPIMLFFTGSDWCGWCIKLQNEVLQTPDFEKWAKANVILVELDYPRRTAQDLALKQQNDELMRAFSVKGFPTVFFANVETNGTLINFKGLGQTGYVAGGPKIWLEGANKILGK